MSTASITTGTTVRITGDTCNMLHGRKPGTIGTVDRIDETDRTAYVRVAEATHEDGFAFLWIAMDDLQVVEEDATVVLPLDSEVLAAQVAGLTATVAQRDQHISTLEHELTRANERVEQFRAREAGVLRDLSRLKEQVTDRLKAAVNNGEIERDDADSILDALGCKRIASKYRVTVEYNGYTVLVVEIEADDEDAAIEEVRDNVSATINRVEIEVEFEYGGDGEVEEGDTYVDEDDSNVDASDYDMNLDFTAEEV